MSDEPILDSLVAALARLALEAEHFRANRIGEQFLVSAINNANEVLERESAESKTLLRIGEVTWNAGLPVGDRSQTLKNVELLAADYIAAREAKSSP